MNNKLKIEDAVIQERVIKHFQLADKFLIALPMILAGILLVAGPIVMTVTDRADGNPTTVGGFDFSGLVIIAGIILCGIFCGGYGLLAVILSVLTRRNKTFRILLVTISLSVSAVFFIWFWFFF